MDTDENKPVPKNEMFRKVERRLAEFGWAQADLAHELGVPPSRITKWKILEPKDFRIKPADLLRIGLVLRLPLIYLCNDEMQDVPAPEISRDEQAVLDLVRGSGYSFAEVQKLILDGWQRRAEKGLAKTPRKTLIRQPKLAVRSQGGKSQSVEPGSGTPPKSTRPTKGRKTPPSQGQ